MSDDSAVLTADERSALVFYGDPPKVKRLGVAKRAQLQGVLQPIDTAWERVSHS